MNSDILQKAVDLIEAAGRVLVTTHTRPDGDACGYDEQGRNVYELLVLTLY